MKALPCSSAGPDWTGGSSFGSVCCAVSGHWRALHAWRAPLGSLRALGHQSCGRIYRREGLMFNQAQQTLLLVSKSFHGFLPRTNWKQDCVVSCAVPVASPRGHHAGRPRAKKRWSAFFGGEPGVWLSPRFNNRVRSSAGVLRLLKTLCSDPHFNRLQRCAPSPE